MRCCTIKPAFAGYGGWTEEVRVSSFVHFTYPFPAPVLNLSPQHAPLTRSLKINALVPESFPPSNYSMFLNKRNCSGHHRFPGPENVATCYASSLDLLWIIQIWPQIRQPLKRAQSIIPTSPTSSPHQSHTLPTPHHSSPAQHLRTESHSYTRVRHDYNNRKVNLFKYIIKVEKCNTTILII